MTKNLLAVPTDIHQLAEDACQSMAKNSKVTGDDISKRHKSLAAGLERVRGLAVQRAKVAHVRLRRKAVGVTALSFGIGVAMGFLVSRFRGVIPESAPGFINVRDAALNV